MSKEAIRANIKPNAPIREPIERKCWRCSGKMEDPTTLSEICYSCWLTDQIPNIRKYQAREIYYRSYVAEEGTQRNATILPKTGIPFLDRQNFVDWLAMLSVVYIAEWRHLERLEGLDNVECSP